MDLRSVWVSVGFLGVWGCAEKELRGLGWFGVSCLGLSGLR